MPVVDVEKTLAVKTKMALACLKSNRFANAFTSSRTLS
jgi:hypothetical protein